ncbi:cytochrome P450 2D17-like [Rhinatrema bivittatum]|uniref:cytochrome P450 2D17-like n=1 Tax=Rhinatrema bivittatum TaxID=194408 RepID=UPI001126C30A|nr:cytochrome P450 2D17-like [Rhinatrema bivittatum]
MELLSVPRSLLSSCCNNVTLLGIFLTVFVLVYDFMKRRKKWSRYPPGPTSLPFFGNMFQIDFKNLPSCFTQMSKKFGNIFSLQLGWLNLIVLNGFEVMKEALVVKSEDIADRPPVAFHEKLGYVQGLVMMKYGHAWKDLRRFSMSTLRDFGLGKKTLEERVMEEAKYLCSMFEAKEGQPFDARYLLHDSVSKVIASMTFGDHFQYDGQKLQKLLYLLNENMELGTGTWSKILNFVPCLRHVPGPHQKLIQCIHDLFGFIKEIIREHKESWDPAQKRDYIDAFLEEIEKAKEDSESNFKEATLVAITSDLFAAGTETTAITLRWALLLMILYPDIQSRVHEEIDRVIGRDRRPVMQDQVDMPFTNAVIHEIQRYGDIIPMGLPHFSYRDTEIQGFFIPKGMTIFINLSSVLKDETYWEEPHRFYPEHFLDAEGQFVKREAFMPFSAGRRVCLGEQLARMELFIFFTTLMQCFTFLVPENQPRPREDPVYAFMYSPHPYEICAKLR